MRGWWIAGRRPANPHKKRKQTAYIKNYKAKLTFFSYMFLHQL